MKFSSKQSTFLAAIALLIAFPLTAPAALIDFETAPGSDDENFVTATVTGIFNNLDFTQNGDTITSSRWQMDVGGDPFASFGGGSRWLQGFAEGPGFDNGPDGLTNPNRAKIGNVGNSVFEFNSVWLRTRFFSQGGGTGNGPIDGNGDNVDDRWLTSIDVLFRDINNNESTLNVDLTSVDDGFGSVDLDSNDGWILLSAGDISGDADLTQLKAIFFSGDSGTEVTGVRNDRFAIDNLNVTVVPVPAAVWLLGTALLGLLGFSRRSNA